MAKSEFGTKRICLTTGKKFYDLNKNPVISPYTGEVVPIAPVEPPRYRSGAARAAPVPKAEVAPEPMEAEELASLEEADAEEHAGKVKAVVPDPRTIARSARPSKMIVMMKIRPSLPTRKKAARASPTSSATSGATRRLEIGCIYKGPDREDCAPRYQTRHRMVDDGSQIKILQLG